MTLNHNCGCFSGVGSGIAGNMSIDEQIKQIQDLGYSVDYNLKGNYITCIYDRLKYLSNLLSESQQTHIKEYLIKK